MQVIKAAGYKWDYDPANKRAVQRGGAGHILEGVTGEEGFKKQVATLSQVKYGLRGKAQRGKRPDFRTPSLDKAALKEAYAPDSEFCASFTWNKDGSCTLTFVYAAGQGQHSGRQRTISNAEACKYKWGAAPKADPEAQALVDYRENNPVPSGF